ncbi:MAG TPA: hypothetical protein VIP46_09935 [Pyrinomonadaceae bacterium]
MSQAAKRVSAEQSAGAARASELSGAELDPRIEYPCYKSFDEFIDVGRLRSLDGYVAERVRRHAAARSDIRFYTGPHRLKDTDDDRPGSRMIYLAQSSRPDSYYDLDRTDLWGPTPACEEFSELMRFIATLPFKATGRMLIMYDDASRPVPAHRDHDATDVCHEFVWFRTNLEKPFYMLNHETGERRYVESYSAWFDTVNQFHGSDGGEGLTFSIRVDGTFTDDFRKLIPRPPANAASTPALWASLTRAINPR